MLKIFPLILLIAFSFTSYSQSIRKSDRTGKNSIFVEFLGSNIIYSLNYERNYILNKDFNLYSKVGSGILPFYLTGISYSKSFSINLEQGVLIPIKKQNLECGIGFTYQYLYSPLITSSLLQANSDLKLIVPRLGYRHYFKNNILIKISITPLILLDKNQENDNYSNGFVPFGGIGMGYCF